MTLIFFIFSLFVGWFAYNLFKPNFSHPHLSTVSFLAGWLVGELALHHIALQMWMVFLFVWIGAVDGFIAAISLMICVISWLSMGYYYLKSDDAEMEIEEALLTGLGDGYRKTIATTYQDRFPKMLNQEKIIKPLKLIDPQVEVTRNVSYGNFGQKLDIYRTPHGGEGRPVLLQIHGGAWTERMGSKNEQALPLLSHMALRDWVCVSVDYRLSPTHTFPAPVIDCKEAIAWLRQHIEDYGGDPNYIIVTGGSAGGHLAALLALTANDPFFQPGFEDVDTRVQGAVTFYGVYDFTNSLGYQKHGQMRRTLESSVMKLSVTGHEEEYRQVSPLFRIHAEAPPFLIIHGDKDTLVPVEEARHFATTLRETSKSPVAYAEIAGAQHAFDMFPSVRSEHVKHGVERYLAWLLSQRPRPVQKKR